MMRVRGLVGRWRGMGNRGGSVGMGVGMEKVGKE